MTTPETEVLAPDAPTDTPDDIAAELAQLDADIMKRFEFIINDDGSVTFVDFPPELLDVAYALNPDDPLVCERRALISDEASS